MQPYNLTISLSRNSYLLLNYLKEFNQQASLDSVLSVKILNGKRHIRASINPSKHLIHSYNSSWDLQENTSSPEYDEIFEYSKFKDKQRKSTVKISRTQDFSPSLSITLKQSRTSSIADKKNFEMQNTDLQSLQSNNVEE